MIFKFKKFAVSHGNSSMRVGTDAVLLGAWTDIKNSENILEIGTGSGVIALMLAQRNPMSKIIAIDIHPESILEAEQNFKDSPWAANLRVENVYLQNLSKSTQSFFDHIVSNPPFFIDSTPSPNKARNQARHTGTLSPDDFFSACKKLLTPAGKISLILPWHNTEIWEHIAEKYEFHPSRITEVFSYPGKPIERILIEFSIIKKTITPQTFYIRRGKALKYTDAYIELTRDFFL